MGKFCSNLDQRIVMTIYICNNMYMNKANIVDIKNNLKHYLDMVAKGAQVTITRRNVAIAKIVPVTEKRENNTSLGCGKGSVEFKGKVTGPLIAESDWEMLK